MIKLYFLLLYLCKGVNVKKVLLFLACFFGFYSSVLANGGPKPWQMDFRPAATPTMEKVVAFHNFVNPIIKQKNLINSIYEEGCLSVPNQFAEIERPNKCEVEYLDFNGNKQLLRADGLLATCIQHEIDHLEGILFIDYLSKLKKSIILKKLSKNKPDRIIV